MDASALDAMPSGKRDMTTAQVKSTEAEETEQEQEEARAMGNKYQECTTQPRLPELHYEQATLTTRW